MLKISRDRHIRGKTKLGFSGPATKIQYASTDLLEGRLWAQQKRYRQSRIIKLFLFRLRRCGVLLTARKLNADYGRRQRGGEGAAAPLPYALPPVVVRKIICALSTLPVHCRSVKFM